MTKSIAPSSLTQRSAAALRLSNYEIGQYMYREATVVVTVTMEGDDDIHFSRQLRQYR